MNRILSLSSSCSLRGRWRSQGCKTQGQGRAVEPLGCWEGQLNSACYRGWWLGRLLDMRAFTGRLKRNLLSTEGWIDQEEEGHRG